MRIVSPQALSQFTKKSLIPKITGALCWLLLVGCGNIGNKKYYEGEGGVQGTTLTPEGKPAPYATILVVGRTDLKVHSGEDGTFVLGDIPAGEQEILMYDRKGLGIRLKVWIVKNRLTKIANAQSTLLPTATLSGRVLASPRLTNQGIQVSVDGTEFLTSTHNVVGDFNLPLLPAGCHTLTFQTPMFHSITKKDVCVIPGDKRTMSKEIQLKPTTSCRASSECEQGNICETAFCVPEGPGQVKILQTQQMFEGIKREAEKTQIFDVLKNVGKGPLLVEKITIEGNTQHFVLTEKGLPSLPHTLQIGETLKLGVTFRALSTFQKEYRATLKIKTNAPETAEVSVSLLGMVATNQSDCLEFDDTEFNKGDQPIGDIELSTTVTNHCGEPIAVSPPTSSKPPPGNEQCAFSVWGSFSMPTCITTPSNTAVVIHPWQSKALTWKLKPQGFGHLEGTLHLVYTEPKRKEVRIEIPVKAYITVPGLTITPRVMEFGAMAPQTKRTLWLSLQFSKTMPETGINVLKTEVSSSPRFKVLSTRLAQTPGQAQTFYLPVEFDVPQQGSVPAGRLILRDLPELKGRPYYIPVRGSVATTTTPVLPTKHLLGATQECTPPVHTLFVTNPGTQPVSLTSIKLQATSSNEFVLSHDKLPLLLPPQTRLNVGTVQWKAPMKPGRRAFAQIHMSTQRGKETPQVLVSSLQGQTGFVHNDTYIQNKSKKLNILVFIDQKTEEISTIQSGLISLLKELQIQHTKTQLEFAIHVMHETLSSPPIIPITNNAEAELRNTLQTRTNNTSHHGLETMESVRKLLRLPNASSNTVALFFSKNEDLSPYEVSAYALSSHQFTLFSAVPKQSCHLLRHSYRYPTATLQSGGVTLDLCQASTDSWKSWFTQITNTLFGQRKRFSLKQKPAPETIRVLVDGTALINPDHPTNQHWTYDPNTNQIILLDYQLPQDSQLNISYYTTCK